MSKNRAMAWGRFIVTLALLGSLVATARDVIAGTTTIATLVQSTREMIGHPHKGGGQPEGPALQIVEWNSYSDALDAIEEM